MVTITLGPDNDTYVATDAGDWILGMGGNDTLTAAEGGNRLSGGDGDDVLNGGAGSDSLTGDDNTNFTFHNVLNGFGGADFITSYSWFDQINAGPGNDVVESYAQQTGQSVNGGTGNDRLMVMSLSTTSTPISVIFGPTFSFSINGINGATYVNFESLYLNLGTGANTVTGGNGNDVLFTSTNGGGADVLEFDAGSIHAGAGDDSVGFNALTRVGSGIQRMDGGIGTDTLTWTGGDAVIGDLTINAATGNLFVAGRKIATFVDFEAVSFKTWAPTTGNVIYTGFAGADDLETGGVSSVVNTAGGNDRVLITAGNATVNGGAGNDALNAVNSGSVTVLLAGGAGNDTLGGGSGMSNLDGGRGDDVLTTYNGNSQVFGGSGDDVLTMYFSTSLAVTGLVDGGAGNDVLTVNLGASSTGLDMDLSTATVTLDNGLVITGVEGFRAGGSLGNDRIAASNDLRGALFNTVDGSHGNDTLLASANGASLNGGFGSDSLIGGAGADLLDGGLLGDNDTLRGNGGNDTLIGGIGRDLLVGGGGADRYVLNVYYESGTLAGNRDLILGFSRRQGDKIDLSAVVVAGPVVDDAFVFIGAADFGNVAGQLRYERFNPAGTANGYTLVSGDINGDAVADFTIEVKGLISFLATDFLL